MMVMPAMVQAALQGRRILVAEDEYMIADEIAGELSDVGAETLGPVPSMEDAARLIATEDQIDGALLDVNHGRSVSLDPKPTSISVLEFTKQA